MAAIAIANCNTKKTVKGIKDSSSISKIKSSNKKLKSINYNLPDDSLSMNDSAKKEFVKSFDKGQIVYNLICAKCHNKIVNGLEVVPDFSLPQLMDYEIRIQYPIHQERLSPENLSATELDDVVNYLRYKKKSGVHF
jgi:uncharacterized protein YicC (UPF0701 family)